ncbi:DUF4231 domain-containing protein [Umezawaea sp. NPDC059074]|uniref:DUF4231 domain-containing protein n=1 Tax=Umezawaea sp. NPDC059074 TaxID=3346716 RepID=UPI0036A5389D
MTDALQKRVTLEDSHWISDTATEEPAIPDSVLEKWHWYRRTSKRACGLSHRSEVLNLALAALAPAVTLTVDQPVIGALLGTAAVIVGGIRATYRWQENWISRSRTRYAIEREITYYKHRLPPYDTTAGSQILVKNVEEITEAEGRAWEAERRSLTSTAQPPTSK